jgi:6-phosphogluconolactonase
MVRTFDDLDALSHGASELFVHAARLAVETHGRFSVVLSGGSTPRRTYEMLADDPFREQVPWKDVHVFWGDERCVPAEDDRSNVRMARRALLDHVPIPAEQIHPMDGGLAPQLAAEQYEARLRTFFGLQPPRFDLVLLGLGDDGHTASLFPGTHAVNEQHRWVTEVYVAKHAMHRITLTPVILNQADTLMFLVAGRDKAAVVRQILQGAHRAANLPVQRIRPAAGKLIWLLDWQAAALLDKEPPVSSGGKSP